MTFRVGQKVVCVDGSPTDLRGHCDLTKGAIYTVRWVGQYDCNVWPAGRRCGPGALFVRVAGIVRDATPMGFPDHTDVPFSVTRFRPLIERKTSTGFEILDEIRRTTRAPSRATV